MNIFPSFDYNIYKIYKSGVGIMKFRNFKKDIETEDRELLLNLEEVKSNMDVVYMRFENATDDSLIDSYIYELKALQMRYEYLMRRIKAKGLNYNKIGLE